MCPGQADCAVIAIRRQGKNLRILLNTAKFLCSICVGMNGQGNLSSARCGERLRITAVGEECASAVRLREMGFCESAEICKVSDGRNCLCLLMGSRVAIGRDLARDVQVEKVPDAAA